MKEIPDIRKQTLAPIIVFSGDKTEGIKIKCLQSGADDYLTKPIHIPELTARIQAHLFRYTRMSNIKSFNAPKPKATHFINWRIDYDHCQLFDSQNNSANLTKREFVILEKLIKKAGKPISRQSLQASEKTKRQTSLRGIDVKVARIRKKIGDDKTPPQYIQTIREIGYQICQEAVMYLENDTGQITASNKVKNQKTLAK